MIAIRLMCLFLLFSSVMASIVINLDEEELQTIAAILVENYIDNNLAPAKKNILFYKYIKKAAASVGQVWIWLYRLGVMVSSNVKRKKKLIAK